MLWKTRGGKKLSLSDMTCQHLRNSLNKIFRDKWRTQWVAAILLELDRRCRIKQDSKEKKKETSNA